MRLKWLGVVAVLLAVLFPRLAAADDEQPLAAEALTPPPGWDDDSIAEERSSKKEVRGCAFARLGGAYRRLSDIPLYLAHGAFAVGGCNANGGDYFEADLFLGRTEAGLKVGGVSGGYRAEWLLAPARVGVAARLGWLSIRRETTGENLGSAGVGLSLIGGIDLIADRMTFELEPTLDTYFGADDITAWGGIAAIVVRL